MHYVESALHVHAVLSSTASPAARPSFRPSPRPAASSPKPTARPSSTSAKPTLRESSAQTSSVRRPSTSPKPSLRPVSSGKPSLRPTPSPSRSPSAKPFLQPQPIPTVSPQAANGQAARVTISVRFHVIASSIGGRGNPSDRALRDQIDVLNRDYYGTGFNLTLTGILPCNFCCCLPGGFQQLTALSMTSGMRWRWTARRRLLQSKYFHLVRCRTLSVVHLQLV